MAKQPKKIIIKNPDNLEIDRLGLEEVISNAINARDNMAKKNGWYLAIPDYCQIITPFSTRTEYGNGVIINTYFKYGVMTVKMFKRSY
jgi:hypothetical protein